MLTFKSRLFKSLASIVGAAFMMTLIAPTPANAALLPPVIATITPNTGTITGGEEITITGANLQYVSSGSFGANYFDQYRILDRAWDGSWVKFRAPDATTTGVVDVTLYGQVNITEPKAYTYTSTGITSVTPNQGTQIGGTAINIKGTGFGPMYWGDSSLIVKIGGANATKVVRVSPTEITAVTPSGTVGQADVVISFTNSLYDYHSNNVITGTKLYTYTAANTTPTIASVSPNKGLIAGGQNVTIAGTYLKDASNVNGTFTFDGLPATVVSMNATGTSAIVTTPAHAAGPVDVKVVTSVGSATSNKAFTYAPPPTVTGVNANSGVIQGGTKVTITGTDFGSTGAPVVKIGGKLALCTKLVSATEVTAVTREGAAGSADVEVTATTGGGTATLAGGYTYANPASTPVISAITPNFGTTAGGTVIDIKSTTAFPSDTPNVMFGQLCATTVTRVDDYTIRVTTPAATAGAKNVSLTFANAYSLSTLGYTYITPVVPEITTISPNTSYIDGGIWVTLTGKGFGQTGTPTLTFGGVAATLVNRYSDTYASAFIPANTAGVKDVVLTPAGGSPITKSGGFTYKGPNILSISPSSGTATGSTSVVIRGDGFGATGTPTVTFGGVAATSVTRVDSNTINAVTPAGNVGATTVVITPPSAAPIVGTGLYTYLKPNLTPLIFWSSPQTGPQAGGITITVDGMNFKGTGGAAPTVKIGGVVPTNITVNAEGTVITFTAPAFGPGDYDIWVQTDEGTAWRTLYRVLPPPTIGSCDTSVSVKRLNPDGGTVSAVFGQHFGTTADAPTIKVGGVVTPVKSWGYDNYYKVYYVTFTDLGGSFGYQDLEVIPADFSGTAKITNCLYRQADASITADDKHIKFGDPTPEFTKTVAGEKGTDKVTTVTYTFTGTGGLTYGPSTTPPTAAGVYTITPSNAAMNPGSIANYTFAYINGTYTIDGIPATVTALGTEKVYGDPDPDFKTALGGVVAGETQKSVTLTFTGTANDGSGYGPSTTPPIKAGTYTITPSNEKLVSGNEPSYLFSYFSGPYVIKKRPVSIVAVDQQKTYGDDDPSFPWEFKDPAHTNMAYNETLLVGKLGRETGENVGVYAINIGELAGKNPNYDVSYELGNLSINKRHISVVADDKEKIYGDNDPTFTYSAVGLKSGDSLVGALAHEHLNDVGDYPISQGTLEANGNYIIDSFTPGNFKIEPRPITIEPFPTSKYYGELDPNGFTLAVLGTHFKITSQKGLVYDDTFAGGFGRDSGENVGDYLITQGGVTAGGNYTITFTTGKKFTINKRPIKLVATDVTKVYGDADTKPFAWTVKTGEGLFDLLNGDTISGEASRVAGENVGDYAITKGTLDAGNNYSLSFDSGKLTITKRAITIKPDALTKQYGDTDPTITYTVTEGALQFEQTKLNGNVTRGYGENVGEYNYTDQYSYFWYYDPNYEVTVDKSNKFTITKKDIAVTALAATKTYGNNDPTFYYTTTPSYMPNYAPINLTGSLGRVAGEDVGDWDLTQGTLDGGTNFNIVTFTTAKLTITKRTIYVKAKDKSVSYHDTLPTNEVVVKSGYSLGFSDALDTATFAYSTTPPVDAGDYTITPSDVTFSTGSASNYDIHYEDGVLTITPVEIEITADNKSKTYGDTDPELTYSVTNGTLFDGDELSGSLDRVAGENVGDHDITVGTVAGGKNYKVTVLGGKLTINKLHIKITPDATKKTYGDANPEYTYTYDLATLPFDDELGGSLDRAEGEDVAKYDFDLGDLETSNTNYEFELIPAQFEIEKRNITVKADDIEIFFGDDEPELTYTSDPLTMPNGAPITITGALARDSGTDAATYNINQGSLDGGSNFNMVFTGGKLTIKPRKIKITATDKSVEYGQTLPDNEFTLDENTPLVGDDSLGSVTYTYSTVPPKNAGDYDISPSALTLTTGKIENYEVEYIDGTLTITPIAIQVTADDKSKKYGEDDPAFTYKVTSGALLTGDELTGDLTRDAGEDVSEYTIKQGALANPNYSITFVTGKLTINKLKIKVTPDATKKPYGDFDPTFTFTTDPTPLPFGDTLDGALGRTAGETVGDYDFNIGDLVEKNGNYDIEFVPGKFLIEKRDITITIKNATKVYGDVDPTFEYTYSPETLPNGQTFTISGSLSRVAGENVGEWNITAGSLTGDSNTNLVGFTGGKLTITKRDLKIVAEDKTAKFGQTLPANSIKLVDGYTLAFSDKLGTASYGYSQSGLLHVGSYGITPSELTLSVGSTDNYSIEYVDGTLTITKGELTIHLENAQSNYGDPAPEFKIGSVDGLIDNDEIGNFDFTWDDASELPTLPGVYVLGGLLRSMKAGNLDDYEVTIDPASYQIDGPQVLTFDPSEGPISGGTCFTIYGTGFGSKTPTILFDGLEATDVVLLDSGTITGCTPAHDKGTVNVQIVNEDGTFDLGPVFTYYEPVPAPSINLVTPNISPTGGNQQILITGANFCARDKSLAKVLVNGVEPRLLSISEDCTTLVFWTRPNAVGNYTLDIITKEGTTRYEPGITYVGGGVKTLNSHVIFDGDRSVLLPAARNELRKIAKVLVGKSNVVITIEGWVHRTSSTRIDQALSLARAKRTAAYLRSLGVVAKITTASKGIYRVGDWRDRRAEINATYEEGPQ